MEKQLNRNLVNKNKTPNIVYVMADDLGYGDLGCYGATKIPTPNCDKIASEGKRFLDAHSSSAVCTPSRYSVLTGRYCWRTRLKHGVMGGYGRPLIEKERPTVATLLKQVGYKTYGVGKWHVGLGWNVRPGTPTPDDFPPHKINLHLDIDFSKSLHDAPVHHGFDRYFGIAGSLDMDPYVFIEDDHTVGIPDKPKHPRYNQQRDGPMVEGWKDEEVDITHAKKAVEYIDDHAANHPGEPFFLYLATSAPHRPCDVRPEFVIDKSQAGDRGDMVVLFDWMVGQVDDALRRNGLVDNTVFFITSDNGARTTCANGMDYGHKSNGELRGQKADIWEGGHREPLIARWPGRVVPGSTNDDLVCLIDLFATVAEITGQDLPKDAAEDSFSFLGSLLTESNGRGARDFLVHHSLRGFFSVRKGRWKMIDGLGSGGFSSPWTLKRYPLRPRGQLYDMDNDWRETTNIWKKKPDIVRELLDILNRATTGSRTRPE